MTIPAQVTDITADWLNARLGDAVGTIRDVTATHIGEGVGILGEVARLHLAYADGHAGPPSLIAKCQSLFAENIVLCQMMGFYEREINFYRHVADQLDINTPRCHVAEMAQGGAPFVLIVDEITDARMIDQIDGASFDETVQIANAAADVHAAYWSNDALDQLTWLPPMNNDMYKGAGALFDANWPAFVQNWADRVPSETITWCEALIPRYPDALDWFAANSPQTLTHTDCRAENYLFGGSAGADAITMLDFQLCTRHIGTWDIANFLGMSVTIDNRRAWEHQIVGRYHDRLIARGVTGYDFDQCWRDYRYCLMHQAVAQVAIANVDPGNERGRTLLDEFVRRSFQAAADNDAGALLDEL